MQTGTMRLDFRGRVFTKRCLKCAKSKLSYKSSQTTVKQQASYVKGFNQYFGVGGQLRPSQLLLPQFSATLPDHSECRIFHFGAVPSEPNRRILESLQFQGEQ